MTVAIADPAEWWLEPVSGLQTAAQQQIDRYSSSNSRWNAFLNYFCLHTVLAWLQTEYPLAATAGFDPIAHAAIWEVVNGSRISLGSVQGNPQGSLQDNSQGNPQGDPQIVLIPSEAIDSSELEVPQEWIDIPGWTADYYLAVQMREAAEPLSFDSVRVWGYATHHQIKTAGCYDPIDRTYCLDARDLNRDLSTLWVTLQCCPAAQTRAVVAPLPELADAQAAHLIQRLGHPALRFPRLDAPFSLWGALLEREEWRQQLYQRRSQPNPGNVSERVQLTDWLQNQLSSGWRSIEEIFGLSSAQWAMGMRSNTSSEIAETIRAKSLVLGSLPDAPHVVLVLRLLPEPDGRMGILVQLYPGDDALLPPEVMLFLLAPTGETLQSATSQAQDDYLQLRRFRCSTGTEFSLQVGFQADHHVESFIV